MKQSQRKEKKYWRSLERLLDSPAVPKNLGDEFPEGITEPPTDLSRRTALKILGASFGLAGLTQCRRPEEEIVPYVRAPENITPGIPKKYATAMPMGTSSEGLLIECHEGRPTKIEGNDLHPLTGGSANVWMQAALLGLYDPDRSRTVLRRSDSEAGAEEASWEDFFDFWAELEDGFRGSEGEGLAILTESFSSPTMARIAQKFRQAFPRAAWLVHEPFGDSNLFEGLRKITGESLRPLYQLENATRILVLDADLLMSESESVHHARGFASGRRLEADRTEMNRLYAIESSLSVTGANADHRMAARRRDIGALALELAHMIRDEGVSLDLEEYPETLPIKEGQRDRLRLIAADLAAAGESALIVAGRAQPPEVHALVYAVNYALGAVGSTLSLQPLQDAEWERHPSDLIELAECLENGGISTLFILGGNPVYTAPADLSLAEALQKASHTVHLGAYADETAAVADWHLPQSHFLESWGDHRSADNTVSFLQPMIAPLFDSRSVLELLATLCGEEPSGHKLLRETWSNRLAGEPDFETHWHQVLQEGVLFENGSREQRVAPDADLLGELASQIARDSAYDQTMEFTFELSRGVHDGRFANVAWLQELPDPITKITWDNAAYIAPETASELGLESGEILALRVEGRTLELPVLVSPGQAAGSVCLTVGYGRRWGRVAEGIGADTYSFRSTDTLYYGSGLQISRTGRRHQFAKTQDHGRMEGRSLVREATLEEFRSDPDFVSAHEPSHEPESLWPGYDYSEGHQWGMTIDLTSCIGCNACIVACQSENNIPVVGREQVRLGREMHWLRVDRYFSAQPAEPEIVFQPVPCMHCENAPCEQVCPVAATVHDDEGLNTMVYNRCIGTRYCSNNCPYKVRRFNFFHFNYDLPETIKIAMNPEVTVRSRGVMEKCTYCLQRINEVKAGAKRAGRDVGDDEVKTACQQTCPTEAIVFGDINNPDSKVTQIKRSSRNYSMLSELYTKPRTSYLGKVRNPNPEWM